MSFGEVQLRWSMAGIQVTDIKDFFSNVLPGTML
jgi:hypothetical protein